jgi:3-oxoacyl-[acyl-carrier-protein] synthase II
VLFPPIQTTAEPNRVAITGAGILTALGTGWQVNADGFRTGRTAFSPVTLFDVSRQRAQRAAQIRDPLLLPATRLGRRAGARLDRAGKMLILAAVEAWTQAAWGSAGPLPLILASTSGGMSLGEAFLRQAVATPSRRRGQPTRIVGYQIQHQALALAEALGISGSITVIANACASGANAIGHAWELVRLGQADRVLTGGYDALSQMVFAGFDSLQALSPTRCRPFDAHRDGLSLGEGAVVFALESLRSAQARHAPILGEIVGYGATTDSYHLTQPQPEGEAACEAMRLACQSAGVGPDQIGYLNAHGTGTPLNDSAEAAAIQRWAGARASTTPVSSTKSGIGHLLGAAGAVEVAVCLMALQGQWLPPTSTTETPDPACGFPLVTRPREARLDLALTNSFGFGGANATLILRRAS